METSKKVVDLLCQPKVAAMMGMTTIVMGGFSHSLDTALAGTGVLFFAAVWAACADRTA